MKLENGIISCADFISHTDPISTTSYEKGLLLECNSTCWLWPELSENTHSMAAGETVYSRWDYPKLRETNIIIGTQSPCQLGTAVP